MIMMAVEPMSLFGMQSFPFSCIMPNSWAEPFNTELRFTGVLAVDLNSAMGIRIGESHV